MRYSLLPVVSLFLFVSDRLLDVGAIVGVVAKVFSGAAGEILAFIQDQ